jgi:2-polyprenyl-3-methyl-5-hydroxy-6-metoxy-1,4-benzoquinol methylase
MPQFSSRSYQKELLDDTGIPFAEIKQNMQELNVINSRLGGHRVTLKGIKSLLHLNASEQRLSIVEIGCGGGDNLRVIREWSHKQKISITLTGIDINKECIVFANGHPENNGIQFICGDYKEVKFPQQPHIIFSSLFCHHFADDELADMLQWLAQNSKLGFFINDLHRHPLAYYSIKLMTRFFSKSRLVKNDAPLSVLRGFSKAEWEVLLQQAGLTNYSIQWQWAFRWLLILPT